MKRFSIVIQDRETIVQEFDDFETAFEMWQDYAMGAYEPEEPAEIDIVDEESNVGCFGAFVKPGDPLRVIRVCSDGTMSITSAESMLEVGEILSDNERRDCWHRVEARTT